SSVVSLRWISGTVSPATSTSPSRGSTIMPLVCTVGVRETSALSSTFTSSTSPGPTRYSGAVLGEGEGAGVAAGAAGGVGDGGRRSPGGEQRERGAARRHGRPPVGGAKPIPNWTMKPLVVTL